VKVTVTVTRRPQIADPQGIEVGRALRDLGHEGVGRVRIDRIIQLEVDGDDPDEVRARVTEMCEQLLANPVMEDYRVEIGP
jgi:phosphoribosylformylglycinamidine synthase PurS subunit